MHPNTDSDLIDAMHLPDTTGPLDDDALRALYAYPTDLSRPWVRVNFVSSLDGAVEVDGKSGALGSPSDKKVFGVLRELADVVVVGAGTVRTENYGGARTSDALRERRTAAGLQAVPPVAVVTASCDLPTDLRLFTDTTVPPIILTSAQSSPDRRHALRNAGADVRIIADNDIDAPALVAAFTDAGWTRVLCEGGPSLFGRLVEDNAVDDLCLTLTPVLTAGTAGRIATSPHAALTRMRRAHVVCADDGTLLGRWTRVDEGEHP